MSTALRVDSISKRFEKLVAVDEVSFEVEAGTICGFIGPNGAGKTTSMRIISTLDLPDEGDVWIDGTSVLEDPRGARQRMGFMPDSYGAYPNLSVEEYLDFYARAYGLAGPQRRRTLGFVSDFTGLVPLHGKPMNSLSKGMRQRLCLAKTLLHDPALLILDEPASGLDPRARVELRELIKALAEMGKAVLVSSHILTELSEICHSVAVIEAGRLVATGSVADIQRKIRDEQTRDGAATSVFTRTLARADRTRRFLMEQAHVDGVRPLRDGVGFEFAGTPQELAGLLAEMVNRDLQPVEFTPREADLEDMFLSLTEGKLQ